MQAFVLKPISNSFNNNKAIFIRINLSIPCVALEKLPKWVYSDLDVVVPKALFVIIKTIKNLPRRHQAMLAGLTFLVALLSLLPSEKAKASRQLPLVELGIGEKYSLDLDTSKLETNSQLLSVDEPDWQTFSVQKGDNLAMLFKRADLTPQETYHVSKAGELANKLLKMMPGDQISLLIDAQGALLSLRYAYSANETLLIDRTAEKTFTSQLEQKPISTQLGFAQGEIESSFWNAGIKAGMSQRHIMDLAGIFGWDIDFALELRQGDHFNLVYEEHYIDGEYAGSGDILAAEFTNQGETFTAIRYEDGNFYTPEGRSMRKSFLRAPVNFKYISSNFTKRRFHPVQKRWKAHRGIDYAAKTGTPVVAAGDGKVISSAYNKFNGHYVFIQHGEKYTTKYLHFSKRKVKKGQTVKQGQVIGYVGSTGLAAGPHLHYEFLVDGVHRNPRTVALPKAKPIAKKEAEKYQLLAQTRLKQLHTNKRIMLAMN